MTGLQVWLHPSSRTVMTVVRRWSCAAPVIANDRRPRANDVFLNSSALWRTASIVRDRRSVFDVAHFDSRGSERTNCGLAPRPRTAASHFHAAHAVIARHYSGVRRGLLGGKWRAFARSAKSERAGTFPREHISGLIGDGHDRVVERSLDVRN